jgi:hypothetical protein
MPLAQARLYCGEHDVELQYLEKIKTSWKSGNHLARPLDRPPSGRANRCD